MMDCISQAQRDRVAAESALEHLHSIIIIYLVQGTKGYVCWSLQYAAGSGIFPFFKKNVIQQLATHKKKPHLVKLCMGLDQHLVVRRQIGPMWEGEGRVKCLFYCYYYS